MDGIHIQKASVNDVATIRQLAIACWWPAYGSYLPHDQIRLMLENMYTENALIQQLETGHYFLVAYRAEVPVGFISFRPKEGHEQDTIRIEKLYVLPSEQGRGTGSILLEEVTEYARNHTANYLELNVYRNNPAKRFYEKQGFVVVKAVDIRYHGYTLHDYIMQKPINP